jgi:hypothetical protein
VLLPTDAITTTTATLYKIQSERHVFVGCLQEQLLLVEWWQQEGEKCLVFLLL